MEEDGSVASLIGSLEDADYRDWRCPAWAKLCGALGMWPAWYVFIKHGKPQVYYEECKGEVETLAQNGPSVLKALDRIDGLEQWGYIRQGTTFTARLKRLEEVLGHRKPIDLVWKSLAHGPPYLLEKLGTNTPDEWERERKRGYPLEFLDRAFDQFGDGRKKLPGRAQAQKTVDDARASREPSVELAAKLDAEDEKQRMRTAITLASIRRTLANLEAAGQTNNVMYVTMKMILTEGDATGHVRGMVKFDL